jgi:hypothetical protein
MSPARLRSLLSEVRSAPTVRVTPYELQRPLLMVDAGTHILNRAADRDWRRLARRSREQRGDLNSANGQHEPNRRWMGAAAPGTLIFCQHHREM